MESCEEMEGGSQASERGHELMVSLSRARRSPFVNGATFAVFELTMRVIT